MRPMKTLVQLTAMLVFVCAAIYAIARYWGWHTDNVLDNAKRRKRRAALQCLHCGYDLRATPTRCPECGHEVG